jgi:hypothetical protein
LWQLVYVDLVARKGFIIDHVASGSASLAVVMFKPLRLQKLAQHS